MRVGWIVVIAGCYYPSPEPGQACSEENNCPTGQECDIATLTCVNQPPPVARFAKVDAGNDATCGIDDDGALWCWGRNESGQLGLGSPGDFVTTPARVVGGGIYIDVAVGENMACALRDDKSLWCWGSVSGGQDTSTPTQVETGVDALTVNFGFCFVKDEQLVCSFSGQALAPDPIAPLVPVAISASNFVRCFIDTDSRLFCFGDNRHGVVKHGDPAPTIAVPVEEVPGKTFAKLVVGGDMACGITSEQQELWCWGACELGQTGNGPGDFTTGCAPAQVEGTYLAVDAYDSTTCAVTADHRVRCFGLNEAGQVGSRGDEGNPAIATIPDFDSWEAITAGQEHSCGLRAGGETWCWGANDSGQLGNGLGGDDPLPVLVDDGDWSAIALSKRTTCGIRVDQSLWCWGMNAYGQLGDGSAIPRDRPRRIGEDNDWLAIAPGRYHTCGLRGTGSLWCWGRNNSSALGNGSLEALNLPTQIGSRADWTAIAAGVDETCALSGTELHCWGDSKGETPQRIGANETWSAVAINRDGPGPSDAENRSIGAITTTQQLFAFQTADVGTAALGTWETYSSGFRHGCGLTQEVAFCIGTNDLGEFGNGQANVALNTTPTQVMGMHLWSTIAAGKHATCGVTTDAELLCWGDSRKIGLPPGTPNVRLPAPIFLDQRFRTVAFGDDHACAIEDTGHLWCWGQHDFGMRGDGTGSSDRPRRVRPPEP